MIGTKRQCSHFWRKAFHRLTYGSAVNKCILDHCLITSKQAVRVLNSCHGPGSVIEVEQGDREADNFRVSEQPTPQNQEDVDYS